MRLGMYVLSGVHKPFVAELDASRMQHWPRADTYPYRVTRGVNS
jgi:hypothetical protein